MRWYPTRSRFTPLNGIIAVTLWRAISRWRQNRGFVEYESNPETRTRLANLTRITQADALRFSSTCAGTCRRTLSRSWDEFSTQATRMRLNWIETALDAGSDAKLLRNKNGYKVGSSQVYGESPSVSEIFQLIHLIYPLPWIVVVA